MKFMGINKLSSSKIRLLMHNYIVKGWYIGDESLMCSSPYNVIQKAPPWTWTGSNPRDFTAQILVDQSLFMRWLFTYLLLFVVDFFFLPSFLLVAMCRWDRCRNDQRLSNVNWPKVNKAAGDKVRFNKWSL